MRSPAICTGIVLSGCREGSGNLVLLPALRLVTVDYIYRTNAAAYPIFSRDLHLGTTAPVGWLGAGFVGSRRQLRHPTDRQYGRADHLAGCPPSGAMDLLRAHGDDWRSARWLHHL